MTVDECFVDHGFSATTYIFKKAEYFAKQTEGIVLNIQIPASSSLLFVDSMTDRPVGQLLIGYGGTFVKLSKDNNVFRYIGITPTTKLLRIKLENAIGKYAAFGSSLFENNGEMITFPKKIPPILFR